MWFKSLWSCSNMAEEFYTSAKLEKSRSWLRMLWCMSQVQATQMFCYNTAWNEVMSRSYGACGLQCTEYIQCAAANKFRIQLFQWWERQSLQWKSCRSRHDWLLWGIHGRYDLIPVLIRSDNEISSLKDRRGVWNLSHHNIKTDCYSRSRFSHDLEAWMPSGQTSWFMATVVGRTLTVPYFQAHLPHVIIDVKFRI